MRLFQGKIKKTTDTRTYPTSVYVPVHLHDKILSMTASGLTIKNVHTIFLVSNNQMWQTGQILPPNCDNEARLYAGAQNPFAIKQLKDTPHTRCEK